MRKRMRCFLAGLLCAVVVLGMGPYPASGSAPIVVTVDGRPLVMDVPPVAIDGRTLVPLRAIFEALGATVEWDAAANRIAGARGATVIVLHLGRTTAYIDGVSAVLDIAPRAIRGRTMVPARFVAESLGATVNWNEGTRTVEITSPIRVLAVSLNIATLSLFTTDAPVQLALAVHPANAREQRVSWQSSDPNVATVSPAGVVTPVAPGKARITAVSVDGGRAANSEVTVLAPRVDVTGVTFDVNHLTLPAGTTTQLVPTLIPINASNTAVSWASSDSTVASVAQTGSAPWGLVTALAAGESTITVTTQDGGFTATVRITVVIAATGVTLDRTTLQLLVGRTPERLVATVHPANATNREVQWSTDNPVVASVDQTGLVTPVGIGTARITARATDGNHSAVAEVTVLTIPVTGITLDRTELSLNVAGDVGFAQTIMATISPTDATNPIIIWTTSNPTVATVAPTGRVQAVAVGTAIITATTQDGTIAATVRVSVTDRVGVIVPPQVREFVANSRRPQFWYNGRQIVFDGIQPFVCFFGLTHYPLTELLGDMGIPFVWERCANARDAVQITYHGRVINISTSDSAWTGPEEFIRLDGLGYVRGHALLDAMREAFSLSMLQMFEDPSVKLFLTDWRYGVHRDEVLFEYIIYPQFRTRDWLYPFLHQLYNALDVSVFLIEHIPEAELAVIRAEVEKIVAGLTSDFERLRAISYWVSTHIYYDFDALVRPQLTRNWTIRGSQVYMVFMNRHGICIDYSQLLDAMLYTVGIPSRIMASQAPYHAWNEVYVDGRWIFVDATWNSRNQFRNGAFAVTQPAHWRFFNIPVQQSPLVPIFVIP